MLNSLGKGLLRHLETELGPAQKYPAWKTKVTKLKVRAWYAAHVANASGSMLDNSNPNKMTACTWSLDSHQIHVLEMCVCVLGTKQDGKDLP